MDDYNGTDRRKIEQFRATRTWNMIVSALQDEMPVGRKRKGFRIHENCFAGDDAVTWIVDYLEQNRDVLLCSADNKTTCKVAITREKATLLLQKFVEQKFIEDVHGRGEAFRDSCRCLYTFNRENVAPLPTFKTATPTIKDNGRVHKNRNGGIHKIAPLPLRCATSLVKTALVSISTQRPSCKTVPQE